MAERRPATEIQFDETEILANSKDCYSSRQEKKIYRGWRRQGYTESWNIHRTESSWSYTVCYTKHFEILLAL